MCVLGVGALSFKTSKGWRRACFVVEAESTPWFESALNGVNRAGVNLGGVSLGGHVYDGA